MTKTPAAYEAIPEELRSLPQWVAWKLEEREGKTTKVPYDPRTGRLASSTDPATWTTLDQARRAAKVGYSGIGFVFTSNDPYTGIDLDHVRDPETGSLDPLAVKIVSDLGSYTEVTQSRTGLHVIVRATLTGPRHRTRLHGATRENAGIEMYDRGRFFVMTGAHLAGSPTTSEERQAQIDALYAEMFPDRSQHNGSAPSSVTGNGLSDVEVKARLFQRGNGVIRLYDGDAYRTTEGSHSGADFALCCAIARITRDPAQIDRVYRESQLFRDKWDSPRGDSTWGAQTIASALAATKRDHGRSNAEGTSESAAPRTWPWLDLITASEMEPPAMLVEGLCVAGDLLLVYAFAGVGKSMFALDLSCSLHLGRPFLGHFATTKAKVGYVDEESSPQRLGQRLAMLSRGYGIDPAKVGLPVFHVQAGDRLDTPDGVDRLFAFDAEQTLDVLVIDTLRRVHRGRENEADDMAQIERSVKELQRRSREELHRPLTVVLLHHSPKPRSGGGGSAPETMARGSSDIFGWVDGALYLHERDGQIQVDHAKARWTEQLKPFVVEIESSATSLRLKYVGNVATKRTKSEQVRELIKRLLYDGPLTQTEIVARAKAEGINRDRSITDALRQMVDDADLKAEKSGRFTSYSLTDNPVAEVGF